MKVIIRGTEQNIKVTSVILEADHANPNMFLPWRCPNDGNIIIQYSGRQVMIVPGMIQCDVPIVAYCRECKNRYLFSSIL